MVTSISSIAASDAAAAHAANPNRPLIDVRTEAEFAGRHARGAQSWPLDQITPAAVAERFAQSEPALLLCQSGSRAERAAKHWQEAGLAATVVTGGTEAGLADGLPMTVGKRRFDIQRQIQVIVGSLVITGVILGYTVNPGWLILSGAIGGGLLFAGLSGRCLLGELLAVMPWNHSAGCALPSQPTSPAGQPD